jgi:hypothetical protein
MNFDWLTKTMISTTYTSSLFILLKIILVKIGTVKLMYEILTVENTVEKKDFYADDNKKIAGLN